MMNWLETIVRYAIVKDTAKGHIVIDHIDSLVTWIKGRNDAVERELRNTANVLSIPLETVRILLLEYIDSVIFNERFGKEIIFDFSERDNDDELKRRYRSLVSIYHPDRNYFADTGIDVTDRTERINKVYQELLEAGNRLNNPGAVNSKNNVSPLNSKNVKQSNVKNTRAGVKNRKSSAQKRKKFNDERYYRVDELKKRFLSFSAVVIVTILSAIGLIAYSAFSESNDGSELVTAETTSPTSANVRTLSYLSDSKEPVGVPFNAENTEMMSRTLGLKPLFNNGSISNLDKKPKLILEGNNARNLNKEEGFSIHKSMKLSIDE